MHLLCLAGLAAVGLASCSPAPAQEDATADYVPPPQDVVKFAQVKTNAQDCAEAALQRPWRLEDVKVKLTGNSPNWASAEWQPVVTFYTTSQELGAHSANLNAASQAFIASTVSLKPKEGWPEFSYYPVKRLAQNIASGLTKEPDYHRIHTTQDAFLAPAHPDIAREAFQPFELYGGEEAILILPDRTAVCVERVPGLIIGSGEGPVVYCEYRPARMEWGVTYQFPAADPSRLPDIHQAISRVAASVAECVLRGRTLL